MGALSFLIVGTAILVAGERVEIGKRVVLFSDPGWFDGFAERCIDPDAARKSSCCRRAFKRYSARPGLRARTALALGERIHQIVLHQDGCTSSRACFLSMHDLPREGGSCGRSAHFLI